MQANMLPYADLEAPLSSDNPSGVGGPGSGWEAQRKHLCVNRRHHTIHW